LRRSGVLSRNGLWRPILDMTTHGNQAPKAKYAAEILDESNNESR
jgi:hypothetical protein